LLGLSLFSQSVFAESGSSRHDLANVIVRLQEHGSFNADNHGRNGRGQDDHGNDDHAQVQGGNGARVTSALNASLTRAQADAAYANGKMDLTITNALISTAQTLIQQVSADTSKPLSSELRHKAAAAAQALSAAEAQMRANIPTGLPSEANHPSRKDDDTDNDQLAAARAAIRSYAVVQEATRFASANSSVDVLGLVNAAQALYKQAYDAYQGGHYDQARPLARAASSAASAAMSVLRAADATAPGLTPPAPSF
jgi:hypothetical protein